jgi:hypothetical protein
MNTDTPRTDEWETYCDESYYHLWRVRRKNERGFNDGYHVHNGDEAKTLVDLLNKQDSELTSARAEITEWRILNGWGGTPEIINDFIKGQQTRIHHAQDLETELTAARAEIERLDTAGIHSCHDKCQRWTCVLRRELKAVTEQRDELLRYNEEFRNETLICADCDSISKEEYDQAIEQRDRLAEALQKLADCDWVISLPDRMDAVRSIAREALQSLTTNKEDQERKSPASDGSI